MEAVENDIKDMENDVKKINCNAILDLFHHTVKCIKDSFKCWFG